MGKIAEKINRSPKTVKAHIDKHNEGVQKRGTCEICKRIHSKYVKLEIE